MVQFRPLGPSAQEIAFLQSHFVRYSKSQKKEFARLQLLVPASADDIAQLQALLGLCRRTTPRFCARTTVASLSPASFARPMGGGIVVNELLALSFTLRIYASVNNHLEVSRHRVPAQSVPVGRSPGGDLYLLDLRPATWGAVCLWRHEQEAEGDGSQHWDNVIAIAPSFTAFLNGFGV